MLFTWIELGSRSAGLIEGLMGKGFVVGLRGKGLDVGLRGSGLVAGVKGDGFGLLPMMSSMKNLVVVCLRELSV